MSATIDKVGVGKVWIPTDEEEARLELARPLRFGDDRQIRSARFIAMVDDAQESYLAHGHRAQSHFGDFDWSFDGECSCIAMYDDDVLASLEERLSKRKRRYK